MRTLSSKTRYAVRALLYLSRHPGSPAVLISELAQAEAIPKKFLEAILLDLNNAGILESKRGRGGGYRLKRSPEQITVAELVQLFDGPLGQLPCLNDAPSTCSECEDAETCGLRATFIDVEKQTLAVLGNTTVADLVKKETELEGQKRGLMYYI